MKLKKITLREIHLPLIAPFETSFGQTSLRRILLVETDVDGVAGWGESTAGEDPYYSYETVETAWHIIRDFLWPMLKGQGIRKRIGCLGPACEGSRAQYGEGWTRNRDLGC
jgi:O-succinylbenzoate synthase